jgi:uncharacterized protein (UPF0332 family)
MYNVTKDSETFLRKALESVAGADSERVNRRYNNCANRCYYGAFQAAIAALLAADIKPRSGGQWGHTFVHGQFAGQLIRRRKLYASALRETLPRLQKLRHQADYDTYEVTETEATRAVRRSQAFVAAIQEVVVRGGERL